MPQPEQMSILTMQRTLIDQNPQDQDCVLAEALKAAWETLRDGYNYLGPEECARCQQGSQDLEKDDEPTAPCDPKSHPRAERFWVIKQSAFSQGDDGIDGIIAVLQESGEDKPTIELNTREEYLFGKWDRAVQYHYVSQEVCQRIVQEWREWGMFESL